ncbi:hypothetical protein FGO68_gene14386 [Halteria grandinella]|uniref:Uncharacterized protein n=1 Tax=Halteria grandinella TaxID=5974 RepID=A0A8J8SV85_HALGN|nr:hypothetical protein FGO68_gene14386 [Halteria grandinella]
MIPETITQGRLTSISDSRRIRRQSCSVVRIVAASSTRGTRLDTTLSYQIPCSTSVKNQMPDRIITNVTSASTNMAARGSQVAGITATRAVEGDDRSLSNVT